MSDTINSETYNKIIELYNEWMNNKAFWFNKIYETDIYLINKYYKYVDNILYEFILNYKYNINDCKEFLIGLIILLDQIPRHYNRINKNKIDVNNYSKISTTISGILINNINNYTYTLYDYCFIYLPYRHINDYDMILNIIKFFINKYNTCNEDDKGACKNYISATINKIYKNITKNIINFQFNNNNINNNISSFNNFEDILYYIPLDNYKPFIQDTLIKKFILELDYINYYNNIKDDIRFIHNLKDINYIIVSLSGGVDSNISLYILNNLCKLYNKTLIAVHINYNNRDTSGKELEFVKYYCQTLNIKLYYRTIYEISRNDCHYNGLRNLYELITKNIRFNFYKQVMQLYNNKALIVLGHNRDDCFENIITNITKKQNYDNLSGMSKISYIDNILFWRPLLDINKSDIINYALENHIPYLEDSTPKWSTRGKIRDVVRPCLENFNNNIVYSFFELKNNMENMTNIIDTFVIPKIYDNFNIENTNQNTIIVGFFNKNEIICDINIWTKLFVKDKFYNNFYKNNKGISYKSIKEFLLAIERFVRNYEDIKINVIKKQVLRNDIIINYYKTRNNQICIKFIIS
jgi:tRNA(Ile)-lysidine synthetase-like protein